MATREQPNRTLQPLARVGVRDLRSDLAAMIRRAGAGERIVITVDGQAAAVLGPPEPSPDVSLETLFAAGLAIPPMRHESPTTPDATRTAVDVQIDDVLDELRGG